MPKVTKTKFKTPKPQKAAYKLKKLTKKEALKQLEEIRKFDVCNETQVKMIEIMKYLVEKTK